ncbi:Crp/Fnr family transcriptional regulator [Undibacterium sp. TJN25]|uniref:Crp/Fnr family transcriptional regulator n=1 Tax=Undibacterium sp. TJN25 TaxID=3413056 RepID=UPI003BF32DDA
MNNSMRTEISVKARLPIPAASNVVKREFTIVSNQLNPRPIGPIQNDLLAALPADELAYLLPHLEFVHLPFDKELYEYGSKLSHVYFPTTAIVALLYVLADGGVTEIGVIGHEGLLGISTLMGESALGTAMVQSAGHAYKMKASVLKEACARGGKLQQLLMRYTQALFAQMAQNSVCGRHYSIDQQLSRWLLDRLDRLPTNELKVTQEMIANMLGVRRESVTEAAGKLQAEGLIQYRRGNITVLDREGLEMHAGECYKVAKHEFDLMLSSPYGAAR